jgi:hypothetical protein
MHGGWMAWCRRVKIRVYFPNCVRPALSVDDHLITSAETETEREGGG